MIGFSTIVIANHTSHDYVNAFFKTAIFIQLSRNFLKSYFFLERYKLEVFNIFA